MRILRIIYWIAVWMSVYTVLSSVKEANLLMEKFVTSQDLAFFAGMIYDLFLAVLSVLGILIITIVYNSPTKETVIEEKKSSLEVR